MRSITSWLKKFLALMDGLQFNLSDRWRENANRRTVLILIVVGALAIYIYLYIIRPPDAFPLNDLVTIPEGSTLKGVAEILYEEELIRSPLAFRLFVKITGDETTLHAGDYLFKEPRDIFSVARIVAAGAFGLEPTRFLVREGSSVSEIARTFGGRLQRFDSDSFLSRAGSMEGYLFPDTYYFRPNANEEDVIQAMRQNFDDHLLTPVVGTTTLGELIDSSGKTLQEIVTLASIIELEAHNTKDRRLISGVLYNRLALDMPLQVDVTFRYTHGKGTFQITKSDLASESPYNTYVNKGLPPTPIANPSLDSLIAAVMPTKSKYLFFLADNSGITHFCVDFECQQANKDAYF